MGIKENLNDINSTLREGVTLIAVSKTKPKEAIMEAYEAGQRDFGENKMQELTVKMGELPADIRWHFIGGLQRNKCKFLDERVALVHSVDRLSLANALDRNARNKGYLQDILLQVNIGREKSKGGCLPEELASLAERVKELSGLHVRGLMALIPDTAEEAEQKKYFNAMQELFLKEKTRETDRYEMKILSMGMSGDYKAAMECGSTMVRIGSAIFGARDYSIKDQKQDQTSNRIMG